MSNNSDKASAKAKKRAEALRQNLLKRKQQNKLRKESKTQDTQGNKEKTNGNHVG